MTRPVIAVAKSFFSFVMTELSISFNELNSACIDAGFSVSAVSGFEDFTDLKELIASLQQANCFGEMGYMNRDPELFISPTNIFPEGRSIVSLISTYDCSPVPKRSTGFGRVARFAWGKDYHKVLKSRLVKLIDNFRVAMPTLKYRVFSGSVPLLEKCIGKRAGLGFIGNNTLLIRPGIGSLFSLSEILWNIKVVDIKPPVITSGCGNCTKCSTHCSTGALSNGILNAGRCISYLTLEKRGVFENWEKNAIGEWILGCDLCQEVCPYNKRPLKEVSTLRVSEFSKENGPGPYLNLSDVLSLRTNDDFKMKFKDTAVLRTKREGLLRNAACVAANTLSFNATDALLEAAKNDSSLIVKEACFSSLCKLFTEGGNIKSQVLSELAYALLNEDNSSIKESICHEKTRLGI